MLQPGPRGGCCIGAPGAPAALPKRVANAGYRRLDFASSGASAPDAALIRFPTRRATREREDVMAESVYKIIEIVGSSPTSWEKAAAAAIQRASSTLRDLRIAEVSNQDIVVTD